MGNFKEDMKAQLEEYNNAKAAPPEEPSKRVYNRTSPTITYECETSGIDLIISRLSNGKCTMKLCIFLSQQDENGNGLMIIKNLRDKTIKDVTSDNAMTFLNGLPRSGLKTGSKVIPNIESGRDFADLLMYAKLPAFIELAKAGLANLEMISESHRTPWYLAKKLPYYYRTEAGRGVDDIHAKLLRHMVNKLAKKNNMTYENAFMECCGRWSDPFTFIWAFSTLADLYDEPFAKRCFDEYLDNERLAGISSDTFYTFAKNMLSPEIENSRYLDWAEVVKYFREGKTLTKLDKNRLWQYMQHAISVGLGKRLDGYLEMYVDYLDLAYKCDGKVKDKYPEYLQVAHDVYSEKYDIFKNFKDQEELKKMIEAGAGVVNQTHDGYQLKLLETVDDFFTEAQQNCNCVASYVDRVWAGRCWVASFRPEGTDVTQLTIEIDPAGKMVQIRGRENRPATEEELKILEQFKDTIAKRMAKKEVKA